MSFLWFCLSVELGLLRVFLILTPVVIIVCEVNCS